MASQIAGRPHDLETNARPDGIEGASFANDGDARMVDDGASRNADIRLLAERLARETGITLQQARELIMLIGTDWNSLLREAQFLKRQH